MTEADRPVSSPACVGAALKTSFATPAVLASVRPVIRTTAGRVRGFVDGDLQVFRGIRYGADTALRRFLPPVSPAPWRGTLDAREFGPRQPSSPEAEPNQSEDCLFLNVLGARRTCRQRPRPVIFYIHGGAYGSGSGSSPLYDGGAVPARRRRRRHGQSPAQPLRLPLSAGIPGFADSGNAGIWISSSRCRWVRDNIAGFGGDPARHASGQSGGGAKIATLMAMPAAAGLFHRPPR